MQCAGGHVHVQHVAIQVFHKNRVGRIFKQIVEPPLAFAQVLFSAQAFQCAAAVVGECLERFQIAFRVGAGLVVLNQQQADDALALANGDNHGGGGIVLLLGGR